MKTFLMGIELVYGLVWGLRFKSTFIYFLRYLQNLFLFYFMCPLKKIMSFDKFPQPPPILRLPSFERGVSFIYEAPDPP